MTDKELEQQVVLLALVSRLDDNTKELVLRMAEVIELNGRNYIVSIKMAMAMLDLPTE